MTEPVEFHDTPVTCNWPDTHNKLLLHWSSFLQLFRAGLDHPHPRTTLEKTGQVFHKHCQYYCQYCQSTLGKSKYSLEPEKYALVSILSDPYLRADCIYSTKWMTTQSHSWNLQWLQCSWNNHNLIHGTNLGIIIRENEGCIQIIDHAINYCKCTETNTPQYIHDKNNDMVIILMILRTMVIIQCLVSVY